MSLRDELLNDPLSRGYSAFTQDAPGILVDMLNTPVFTMIKSRFVTARGVLAEHGAQGAAILDKLDAASSSNSAIKWAMIFASQDSGIDIGHQNTRALLDAIVPAVLTQAEADLIKNMAIQPASRAEILGFGWIRDTDICAALA